MVKMTIKMSGWKKVGWGGSGMGGTRREGMTGLPQISKHGQACAYDEQGEWFNHPDLSLTRSLGLGLELGSVE